MILIQKAARGLPFFSLFLLAILAMGTASRAEESAESESPIVAEEKKSPAFRVRERFLPNGDIVVEFLSDSAPTFFYREQSAAQSRIEERDSAGELRMWQFLRFKPGRR